MTRTKKRKRYPELNALKGRIREFNTTYTELSAQVGLTTSMLSNKINGFYAFSGPEMAKIAEALEIDPKEICKFFLPTYCEMQH